MESVTALLKELEPVRHAPKPEARSALLAALWRRSNAEIAELSIQFAQAGMADLASMCRVIAGTKQPR
jgi:hypothetical protein